jgi:hypothetical protein
MRSCACGCGEPVEGRRRFVNDAHRQRAGRRRRRVKSEPARPPVDLARRFVPDTGVTGGFWDDDRGWRTFP